MTARERRRECPRCCRLRGDLVREREIHDAEVKVAAIMESLPPARRWPVLKAAAALLDVELCEHTVRDVARGA